MSASLTNIRVFVTWAEQTVFAGEEIECQITFKNTAIASAPKTSLHPSNGSAAAERQKKTAVSHFRDNTSLSPRISSSSRGPPSSRGHRTTMSLSAPIAPVASLPAVSASVNGAPPKVARGGHAHKRSVSIMSLGASEGGVDDFRSHGSLSERPRAGPRGHERSASLQLVPRRQGSISSLHSGEY